MMACKRASTSSDVQGCLARCVQNLGFLEYADGFRSRRHVGTFTHGHYAVGYQLAGLVAVDFVLSGRRQCDVCLFAPRPCACHVFATVFLCIFTDTSAIQVLKFHDVVELFAVDSVRIVDVTV